MRNYRKSTTIIKMISIVKKGIFFSVCMLFLIARILVTSYFTPSVSPVIVNVFEALQMCKGAQLLLLCLLGVPSSFLPGQHPHLLPDPRQYGGPCSIGCVAVQRARNNHILTRPGEEFKTKKNQINAVRRHAASATLPLTASGRS